VVHCPKRNDFYILLETSCHSHITNSLSRKFDSLLVFPLVITFNAEIQEIIAEACTMILMAIILTYTFLNSVS